MSAALTSGSRPARSRFHRLAVTSVDPVAADGSAVAVTLAVPAGLRAAFAFTPGQHVTVRTTYSGAELRRCYSLCSTPAHLARDGVLRIGIRAVPGGAFSGYAVRRLAPGDELDVLPPVGGFTTALHPGRHRHYAAIAAGSGITPVLSLAAAALTIEPRSRFTVLYGNRCADAAMFSDELADLKDRYLWRFHLVRAFSREERRQGLAAGRLDAAGLRRVFAGVLPPGTVDEWFLCGTPGLIAQASSALRAHGVPEAAVRCELFSASSTGRPRPTMAASSGTARAGSGCALTVLLDGRSTTVALVAGQLILDAALRNRPELPYSCASGVCGTCRARVVRGTVAMAKNWALSPEEVASDYVLTCQATAVSAEVTVDFDR